MFTIFTGVARIFSGEGEERPGHLKAMTTPPPHEGRPDGSEVSFFETIESIRKWIHFSKMSAFFFLKRSIFSKKDFEKLNLFYKNFWILKCEFRVWIWIRNLPKMLRK